MLLRRDLAASLRVLRHLQAAGRTVAVTFKEAGAVQLAARLKHATDLRLLRAIVETADGCIAPTRQVEGLFNSLLAAGGGKRRGPSAFIPTPYPVEDERWNFSQPVAERAGIFIGTREFSAPSRQHLAALLAACRLHQLTGEPVTVINTEGGKGRQLLAELGFSAGSGAALRLVNGPLGYTAYLREVAKHRLVFQLDRSGVPGQVAGDALLCRLPCVGGDGAVERIAFPALAGADKDPGQLMEVAQALLADPARYEQACQNARTRALESLSFGAIAARLTAFYAALDPPPRQL